MMSVFIIFCSFFFKGYGDHRDLHGLTHSFPTRRSSDLGVIPIINENDTVATERIRFGDNDRLAARIGQASDASGVILLSDIDGLYDSNPHTNPDATLIPVVETIDGGIEAMADRKSDRKSTRLNSSH